MKIDQTTLKAFTTEVSSECMDFISSLRKGDSIAQFAAGLDKITEWHSILGKIEMGRWSLILNDCDDVLELATRQCEAGGMTIDHTDEFDRPVISVLRFTSLLFENSFSRSVYSSVDHLFKLLESNKMFIVVQTLRLLLVISKSSRYITQHVKNTDKRLLYMKLTANTESWTSKLRAYKMSEYLVDEPPDVEQTPIVFRTITGQSCSYHINQTKTLAEAVQEIKHMFNEPEEDVEESERILALTKLRIAYNFDTLSGRAHCVMARLISISVLFYSRCLLDEWRINCLLHDDFIEQVCALIQLDLPHSSVLMDALKTEALKTLGSIVFLEKPRKIQLVVDCLGLNSYHGFTSSLIRVCVDKLKTGALESNADCSISFVTALFSLVYHIAGFDYGGESLITSSMVGSLLIVVKTHSLTDSQISFVTRAVRIIDILTGIDVAEFNTNDGMNVIVNRFVHEVENCRKHNSEVSDVPTACHQQRVALMKSLLNFLKRAIADTNYTAQIRRIMEADLPRSIIYIIENPEYFGPSLLHCAIQLTTSFIYQEPAQLTFLQDNGLTEAMLNSLFNEKFPVSRDIVTGLPNICSALCLNERGLAGFNEYKPFERIFRIIFSTRFITSVRKRKTEILEAATALGTAFDELMRHQPTLRKDLLTAFAKVLDDIIACGNAKTAKCVIAWTIGKMSSPDDEFLRSTEPPTSSSDGSIVEAPLVGISTAQTAAIFHHSPSEGSLGQCDASAVKKLSAAAPPPPFRLCHENDGVQTLPFGDYLGIIGAMVEAILTNRAAHENSTIMLECGIPQRLVSLLTLDRPYPALLQSPFLHNLSTIIRHLLCQTNKIDAFDALMQNISTQLKLYECAKSVDEFNRNRMFLVNRINALAYVACNFLKTSLNNVHDIRALLLKYFGTTGLDIIPECFDSFRRLYIDIIFLNVQIAPSELGVKLSHPLGGVVPEAFAPSPRIASIIPAPLLSEEISVADPPLPTKEPTPSQTAKSKTIDLIHASIHRLQKQLSDIVTNLSKIFCSTVTRPRRGFESSLFAHTNDASKRLFEGMARMMAYDELLFQSKNWSCMYICHIISILKKLLFDDYHGSSIMLPFFYSTGCHQSFFALGQFIVENESEMLVVMTTAWLSIIQRLVNVNNVNTGKNKSNSPLKVDGFEAKKYLSICQQDSLVCLQKFFKSAMDPAKDKEKARDLLEKILGTIQSVVRGIVQLHDLEKKDEKQPEFDTLMHEIDPQKVQCLVEMGFSQSDVVDALLIHTSVSDATDYLITLGGASSSIGNSAAALANRSYRGTIAAGFPVAPAQFPVVSAQFPMLPPPEQAAAVPEGGADALEQILQDLDAYEQGQGGSPIIGAGVSLDAAAPGSSSEQPEQMDTTPTETQEPQIMANEPGPSTSAEPQPAGLDALKVDGILPFNSNMASIKTIEFQEYIEFLCNNIVPDCIDLVTCDGSLVYSVADLFAVFMNEPGASAWFCDGFVVRVFGTQEKLLDMLRVYAKEVEMNDTNSEYVKGLVMPFAALLHLFCLLWQTIDSVKTYSLLNDSFIKTTTETLYAVDDMNLKWSDILISPLLLCLDLYDRKKRADIRLKFFTDNVEHVQWSYFVADRYSPSQEWRDYPPICSASLNQALHEGAQTARVTIAEKTYVVDFVDMLQRPADANATPGGSFIAPGPVFARAKLKPSFKLDAFFKIAGGEAFAENGSAIFSDKMVCCLLGMLKNSCNAPQPLGITYSILSLLLRILSIKGMTDVFVENDGVKILLRLRCNERRRLLSTICTMVLRTCLDDDQETLDNAFAHIIRGVESGTVTSLSDMSSRTWFAKAKRTQREWRRISRSLLPLAAFSASTYYNSARSLLRLRGTEVELVSSQADDETNPNGKEKTDVSRVASCGESSYKIMINLVATIIDELFAVEASLPLHNQERVFNASTILSLLAELLRSYEQAALLLVSSSRRGRSIISLIIDLYIMQSLESPEAVVAAKAVLVNLLNVGGSIASKASEIIVNDTKTLLFGIIIKSEEELKTESSPTEPTAPAQLPTVEVTAGDGEPKPDTSTIQSKLNAKRNAGVTALASLIMLLRDYAQENGSKNRDIKQTYSLIRHIHKKNLVVDFAKAIWYLPLREKQTADTIHTILHLFECVAQDLIAINSVRSANATAATASATAAAAIAAATQTAAQVQARAADPTSLAVAVGGPSAVAIDPSTLTPVTNSANVLLTDTPTTITAASGSEVRTTSPTAVGQPESSDINVLGDQSSTSNMDDTLATAPFQLDSEISDLNVSQVLANIGRARREAETESDSSGEDVSDDEVHTADHVSEDGSEDSSEGSDGEGNNTLHEHEVGGGADIYHQQLGIVRASTPISEDDLDHREEEDEMEVLHNDRVIIGDEETQRDDDDDDDDDEDGMDEDVMNDDEVDDEFDDVLTDMYMQGEGGTASHSIHFNVGGGAAGGDPTANVRVLIGNEFFPGNMTNGLVEFTADVGVGGLADLEMHMANILSGRLAARTQHANPLAMTIPLNERMSNLSTLFGADGFESEEADSNYHPLLRRPESTHSPRNDNQPPQSNQQAQQPLSSHVTPPNPSNNMQFVADPSMNILANNPPSEGLDAIIRDYHDEAVQRLMLNRAFFNVRRMPQPAGLRRQNALRRWHPIPNGGAVTFGNGPGGRGGANRFMRLFEEPMISDGMYRPQSFEQSAERRFIQLLVPFFLDRVFEQLKMRDGSSMHYISLIITSYLEQMLLVTEENKPTGEPTENQVTAAVENTNEVTATDMQTPPAVEHEGSELATETAEHLQITGNDTATPFESSDDTRESEMSGVQVSGVQSMDVAPTTEAQVTDVPQQMELEQQQSSANIDNEVREPMEVDTTAVASNDNQPSTSNVDEPSTINEFREILGDIEIPEGVDPAFLAALPEDIRQEVIRDHMVQQRAQRINNARRTRATADGETAAGGEHEDDVLDQEFLAALVPELQEEVLAQHEQRLAQRNQQAAAAAAATAANNAAPPADGAAAPAAVGAASAMAAMTPVDVEAIFESLPPSLRAQVLADADDSVLQILPPNLLAEANRLRANLEQQQVFQFTRLIDRVPRHVDAGTGASRTIRHHHHHYATAGQPGLPPTAAIEQKGVQMFDKESLSTLLLLYFMDQEKSYLARLQKLLKSMCLHSGTCDQIIWGILSILNVLNNVGDENASTINESWLDSFHTQTALNQTEKVLSICVNGVKVHSLVRSTVAVRILDTLILLAKSFPQHFLPSKLRQVPSNVKRFDSNPDLDAFWTVAQEIARKGKNAFKPSIKPLTQLREIIPSILEKSPLAFLLEFTYTDVIKNNANLMDKCLKILQIVTQSIPSDSQAKINDSSAKWLADRLNTLADTIVLACCDEGLKDGRLFFIEVIRILPTLRSPIFDMLYETVRKQGEHLQIDINALLAELEEFKKSGKADMRKKAASESDKSATAGMRPTSSAASLNTASSSRDLSTMEAAAEADVQLITLEAFTKRNSQPKKFLKALETISYLRNQLKLLVERRKRASNNQPAAPPPATTSAAAAPQAVVADAASTANTASVSGVTPAAKKQPAVPTTVSLLEDTTAEERYLAETLDHLEPLWNSLSTCLEEMSRMLDSHAVLSLQQAAEAFFLAHAFAFNQKELESQQQQQSQSTSSSAAASMSASNLGGMHVRIEDMNKYTQKMFHFAEKHRTVLNQILRGNTNNLMEDSAFAILTSFPKLLDFDVKRKYFYKEIRRLDDRTRHDDVAVRIRRNHLFGDSFRELIRLKPADWKSRFYIIFEGEEGQDAGGLLREWYSIITREVFNPNYALFITAPGDRVTYMINKSSYINPEHLDYFKFIGRVIAKAIYDNKQLDCYFTRAFYKHILNVPVRYQDIESEDPSYFSSLEFLLNNPVEELGVDLTFSVEVEEFGERSMRKLREDGDRMQVNDANKEEYVQLVCQMKMTGSIRKQLDAFLDGFYQVIPKKLISIFNEQELELLLSGLPEIDIDDLCNNTDYKGYNRSSSQIQWFWRALRSFEQEDLAKFLQFVTGTSKVPLQGFSHLEGMNGVQKFTIHMDSRANDRLPSAHTCFNQLDLPKYDSYEQLREMLLLAIRECSEGFAFA